MKTYEFHGVFIVGVDSEHSVFEDYCHKEMDDNMLRACGIHLSEINAHFRFIRLYNNMNNEVYLAILGKDHAMQFATQTALKRDRIVIKASYSDIERSAIQDIKKKPILLL